MSDAIGYENDKCAFCGDRGAGYQRRNSHGQYQDACEDCARKPYKSEKSDVASNVPEISTSPVSAVLENN